MMSRPRLRAMGAAVAAAVLAAACGTAAPEEQAAPADGPRVVVTTTILGDVVASLVGDRGSVEVLMEPGQDPHAFEVSARQTVSLREADLVVANGLGLEASLDDDLEAAEAAGTTVLHLAEHLDPLALGDAAEEHEPHADDDHESDDHGHESEDHDEAEAHETDDHDDGSDDHAHEHGDLDPHVWFDPVRMAEGVRIIASRLAEVDPSGDDEAWAERGNRLAAELEDLDAEVAEILSVVPGACRQLVTDHDSFGYLAARHDLEVVGTVIPGSSTQAEPSAQDFAALAEALDTSRVPAIFVESTVSQRLATSLAEEVGREIQIVELYAGGLGEPGSGAETYAGLLRTDAQRIADALADC